jgi:glutamyl-tRNA synthetase
LDEMRKAQEANHQAPMYDKQCRNLSVDVVSAKLSENIPHVVRMKIPENQQLRVHDEIVGDIVFDSNLIDEQVILKSDGFPTYHLAVVVDDYLMGITHVFRGTEWVPSYPKHVLLWQYFGWEEKMPKFIHIPLLLNSEGGGKLSKRHAHTSVDYYRDEGFLPEAVINYLANIVWNHPEEKEIFTLEEFGGAFDVEKGHYDIRPNGVRFDLNKLLWMNGEYIRAMSDAELTKRLEDFLVDHPDVSKVSKLVPLIKERIKKLSDFVPLTNFIFVKPEQDEELYRKIKIENMKDILNKAVELLSEMEKPWDSAKFEEAFRTLAEKEQIQVRDMFQLLRAAIAGQLVTPPLFESIQIMGEDEVLERVKAAADFVK